MRSKNQNKKNQIYWLRYLNENLERNLASAQQQIEKIPEMKQEIEYLKSRIRNLKTQLQTSQDFSRH